MELQEVLEVLGQRYINPAELEEWQLRNEVGGEDETIEFQVQGKFSANRNEASSRSCG